MRTANAERSTSNVQRPSQSSTPAPTRNHACNRCGVLTDEVGDPSRSFRITNSDRAISCEPKLRNKDRGYMPCHPERSEGSPTGRLDYTNDRCVIPYRVGGPSLPFGM